MGKQAYEVIVIGAGHAGCEAALASARMGCLTLLLTISLDKIALMPCNPAIGGIGKGQLVREIDALGGEMGKNTDFAAIQLKVLNRRKGPAVQALRAQTDKKVYEDRMKRVLWAQDNLSIRQGSVTEILLRGGEVDGVRLACGFTCYSRSIIIATGTFLQGQIVIGDIIRPAGRMGELPSLGLSDSLVRAGINIGRFQSATPPRVDARSLDYSKMTPQLGDDEPRPFSHTTQTTQRKQAPCYLTYTSKDTHRVVEENLHLSPIKTGAVTGHGPRNCPSIDRKIMNFPEKERHPVFVEPEGWHTTEMYLQGLTTSLPVAVQEKIIRNTPGLENARIMRPGYAVAYDFIYPDQLYPTLETKAVPGLYTAGQINGTSGYEEAAAQGLIAGINAALRVQGKEPFVLDRSQAYIGVLIDDLVTKGVDEPYRMFTSRAEYRLLLRSDNADIRLSGLGFELGLIDGERHRRIKEKERLVAEVAGSLESTIIQPTDALNDLLVGAGTSVVNRSISVAELLRRPQIAVADIEWLAPQLKQLTEEERLVVEVDVKYAGYVRRQLSQVKQFKRLEARHIPAELDYTQLHGLSIQAREKLTQVRPRSLGQASRVSGVTPADINALLVHLEQSKARSPV
ncbi:MAG: tRNA uridine-5-carboxymethylaminomethyl(34) synthesis enzyme MnmG [Actinomycetota bacterium]|nr:tRNA uridine-5-carboxymethylaminomethyl(34) synthesis enzyme MnmG [Actinomycetota bacterium]